MPDCVLALDVGGTSVKLALTDLQGLPLEGTVGQLAFDAEGDCQEILDAFRHSAVSGRRMAAERGYALTGCGIAFPGPFDYAGGVSRMAHKMKAIQGVPLTPVFQEVLGDAPVRYLHDSTAYLLGEAFHGAAAGAASPALVTLGTGFGFAYMRNGRVRIQSDQRPHVILWNAPYRQGIVEDYVSRRAIRQRYAARKGIPDPPDVAGIASLAREGDKAALETFDEMGGLLADILRPVLKRLGCDVLVVGGQIARSSDLFLDAVRSGLPLPVRPAARLGDAALCGTGRYCALPRDKTVEEVGA